VITEIAVLHAHTGGGILEPVQTVREAKALLRTYFSLPHLPLAWVVKFNPSASIFTPVSAPSCAFI